MEEIKAKLNTVPKIEAEFEEINIFAGGSGGDGVTFTPTVSPDGILSWTNNGELENPKPVNIKGQKGDPGYTPEKGKDYFDGAAGVTFTPAVSSDGILSWTNNGELENPEPVNIRGPKGDAGTTDHNQLTNRDAADQHPISAITGLQTALDNAASSSVTDHAQLFSRNAVNQHPATSISYNGQASGLQVSNVQDAIDVIGAVLNEIPHRMSENVYETVRKSGAYTTDQYLSNNGVAGWLHGYSLAVSENIPVSPGDVIRGTFVNASQEGQTHIGGVFNSSGEFITSLYSLSGNQSVNYYAIVPQNAAYVRFNLFTVDTLSYMYIDRSIPINVSLQTKSRWAGKIINVLGDSITYGYGLSNPTTERFTSLLAQKTGATINNYGQSGSKISKIEGDEIPSFLDRVGSMDKSADLIIVFGGTNDYWHAQTPIGTEADGNSAFKCALSNVIQYILQWGHKGKELVVITPFNQCNKTSSTVKDCLTDLGYGNLEAFRNAILEVCSNCGVPVLDLWAESGMDIRRNNDVTSYFTQDGIHPNATGHQRIADRLFSFIEYRI